MRSENFRSYSCGLVFFRKRRASMSFWARLMLFWAAAWRFFAFFFWIASFFCLAASRPLLSTNVRHNPASPILSLHTAHLACVHDGQPSETEATLVALICSITSSSLTLTAATLPLASDNEDDFAFFAFVFDCFLFSPIWSAADACFRTGAMQDFAPAGGAALPIFKVSRTELYENECTSTTSCTQFVVVVVAVEVEDEATPVAPRSTAIKSNNQ
mmetsp:Transcript_23892/g.60345  ORF Transcript_23892/g.60345 Transcript_23892/m.60345 type:complete len:215 (-) Transcript_23892:101-745(-)